MFDAVIANINASDPSAAMMVHLAGEGMRVTNTSNAVYATAQARKTAVTSGWMFVCKPSAGRKPVSSPPAGGADDTAKKAAAATVVAAAIDAGASKMRFLLVNRTLISTRVEPAISEKTKSWDCWECIPVAYG